jgi:hypothetical protein
MHEQILQMGRRVGDALVPGADLPSSSSCHASTFDRTVMVWRNPLHCQFCIAAVHPSIFFGALFNFRVDLGL